MPWTMDIIGARLLLIFPIFKARIFDFLFNKCILVHTTQNLLFSGEFNTILYPYFTRLINYNEISFGDRWNVARKWWRESKPRDFSYIINVRVILRHDCTRFKFICLHNSYILETIFVLLLEEVSVLLALRGSMWNAKHSKTCFKKKKSKKEKKEKDKKIILFNLKYRTKVPNL